MSRGAAPGAGAVVSGEWVSGAVAHSPGGRRSGMGDKWTVGNTGVG